MDYNTLSNEINQSQYAGMTDAEIAAALNAPGASTRRRVTIAELQARAMDVGVYVALRTAVADPAAPAQLRAICQTVLDLANAKFDTVDLDNASAATMFHGLVQAGVITPQQAAAIDALATVPGVSRAQALGLGVVEEADIAAARKIPLLNALRARLAAGYNAAVALLDAAQAVPEWADLVGVIEAA